MPPPPPAYSLYETYAGWESAMAKHFANPPAVLHPLLKMDSRGKDLLTRYAVANRGASPLDVVSAVTCLKMMAGSWLRFWEMIGFQRDRSEWLHIVYLMGVHEIPSDVLESWFQDTHIIFEDAPFMDPRCVHRPSLRDLAFNALALAEPMKVLELPSSLHPEYYRRRAIQQLKAGTMTPEDFAVVMIRLIQGANIE